MTTHTNTDCIYLPAATSALREHARLMQGVRGATATVVEGSCLPELADGACLHLLLQSETDSAVQQVALPPMACAGAHSMSFRVGRNALTLARALQLAGLQDQTVCLALHVLDMGAGAQARVALGLRSALAKLGFSRVQVVISALGLHAALQNPAKALAQAA